MKRIVEFLTSLRTAVWLLSFLTVALLAGAFVMPVRKEFETIHSLPMFRWIMEQSLAATWWLWAALLLIALLTVNTLFCSIESLIRKRKGMQWLLLISPQIVHIGFLFMLLAHLSSATGAFKGTAVAQEGTALRLPGETTVQVKKIHLSIDPSGYLMDWAVDIEYLYGEAAGVPDSLMPNRPSFHKGIGIYVKDLRAYPSRAVLLEVSREPGALWALVGGVLFMVGTIALLVVKVRREGRE